MVARKPLLRASVAMMQGQRNSWQETHDPVPGHGHSKPSSPTHPGMLYVGVEAVGQGAVDLDSLPCVGPGPHTSAEGLPFPPSLHCMHLQYESRFIVVAPSSGPAVSPLGLMSQGTRG